MSGFVRAESMDISNDPRFFTPNVLDKRFAAFAGVSVCASLCSAASLNACFSMRHDWDLLTVNGFMLLMGFCVTNIVLFFNLFAAYTSVAQIYLTYRLMTAGATGFEIASSFYLNPNIAFWRHAAMKKMLLSLPLFLLSGAFRIFVSVDTSLAGAGKKRHGVHESLGHALSMRVGGVSLLAALIFLVWLSAALLMYYVNHRHLSIFKELYAKAKDLERPLVSEARFLSERNRNCSPEM